LILGFEIKLVDNNLMGGVKSVPEKPAAKRKCLEEVYFKGEQLF